MKKLFHYLFKSILTSVLICTVYTELFQFSNLILLKSIALFKNYKKYYIGKYEIFNCKHYVFIDTQES